MQISDNQVKKSLEQGTLAQQTDLVGQARKLALRAIYALGHADESLVSALSKSAGLESETRAPTAEEMSRLVADVNAMDDREDRIADLKARIESGSYNPAGADIADAMIRRAIADRMA